MAHFAEIDPLTNIVLRVIVIPDEVENQGSQYIKNELRLDGIWEKTSYNSHGGVHYITNSNIPSGKPHFRYNFAAKGYQFDPNHGENGAFIPPKINETDILNYQTCLWETNEEQ